MEERCRNDVSDGWCSKCKGRQNIRESSFFTKSCLTCQKWMITTALLGKTIPSNRCG